MNKKTKKREIDRESEKQQNSNKEHIMNQKKETKKLRNKNNKLKNERKSQETQK